MRGGNRCAPLCCFTQHVLCCACAAHGVATRDASPAADGKQYITEFVGGLSSGAAADITHPPSAQRGTRCAGRRTGVCTCVSLHAAVLPCLTQAPTLPPLLCSATVERAHSSIIDALPDRPDPAMWGGMQPVKREELTVHGIRCGPPAAAAESALTGIGLACQVAVYAASALSARSKLACVAALCRGAQGGRPAQAAEAGC
jgi:hypothetical protein